MDVEAVRRDPAWDALDPWIGLQLVADLGPEADVRRPAGSDRLGGAGGRSPAFRLHWEVPAGAAGAAEAQVLLNASVGEPLAPPDDSRHLAYLFASTGNPLYQLRLAGVACPTPDSFLPVFGPRPKRYFPK